MSLAPRGRGLTGPAKSASCGAMRQLGLELNAAAGLRLASVLGLGWAVGGAVLGAGVDWYRWRGPDCNGLSRESGWLTNWPADGPRMLWKAVVGQGYSSVSVSQGRLYTMGVLGGDGKLRGGRETVWCLDAQTGAVLWQHSYPYDFEPKYYDGGSSATPTVDGNRVFTLGQNGTVNCLDALSGELIWTRQLARELGCKVPTWGFASSPLVQGDLLIVNVGSAGTALDKATGKVVWSSGTEPAGYSSAVPYRHGGQAAVALCVHRAAVGVAVQTGRLLWSFPWKTEWDVNAADPIVTNDLVFISSGYQRGAALLRLDGAQPSLVWENKAMRNHVNSSVLTDGFLYGPDDDVDRTPLLRCVELATGTVRWTFKDVPCSALMAADGKLIAQGTRGEVFIVEARPDACRVLAKAKPLEGRCWTTPVLSQGRLYCRNSKGELVCLDVRAPEPSSGGSAWK